MIKIKILHICSYYYGTKLYKNMMDRFLEQKVDFSVYAPCANNFKYDGNEEYLIKAPCFNKWDRLLFYYKYGKVYNDLIKRVNVKEYSLLHAHSLFANGYIAYEIYKKYNIPYIVAVRNTDVNVFFKYFINLRKLGVNILKNSEKIILISNAYKEKILKYIPKEYKNDIANKCIVIPNGIDNYFLENVSKPKVLDNQKLNLVFTGRIDKNKNLDTTIKCCNKILKNKYSIKFTVIGPVESKKYNKILRKYDFINYVGPKNKEEIIEIYKNMDIFVMPSKHETFGLVYVEAMSQGLPVIYTRNEGFDQFFEDGVVGYSMKYNDYRKMSENIENIFNNYSMISKNCIEKSIEFDWNKIARKYIQIYNEIK